MAALTKGRNTRRAEGDVDNHPVLNAVNIFPGAMVVLDANGNAKPAVTELNAVPVGRAEEAADNTNGAAGDISVNVKRGVFRYENSSAGDEITRAHIGDDCFIVDDQTLALTDGTNTRSVAGKIVNVDALGVWVALGVTQF